MNVCSSNISCGVTTEGAVRCWGPNNDRQLGFTWGDALGDDEPVSDGPTVPLSFSAVEVACGNHFACARSSEGSVECWGSSNAVVPQIANYPSSAGQIDFGAAVTSISARDDGICALLETGSVRCAGFNEVSGTLGYPRTRGVGDNETVTSRGDIVLPLE